MTQLVTLQKGHVKTNKISSFQINLTVSNVYCKHTINVTNPLICKK